MFMHVDIVVCFNLIFDVLGEIAPILLGLLLFVLFEMFVEAFF